MPTSWQNLTDSGSPPCSPQIPTSRFGRVFRPRSMPIFTSSPTPTWSIAANGSCFRIPSSRYAVRILFTSSREKPNVVWVRSLVPKEKNSASLAISSDDEAGAGQLNHRAHEIVHVLSLFLEHFLRHATHNRSLVLHLFHRGDQRDHHLCVGLDTCFLDGHSGFDDGPGLHLGNLGIGNPQAASAKPEHGVELVQLFHARQQSGKNFLQVANSFCAILAIFRHKSFLLLCIGTRQARDIDHKFFALGQKLV